MPGFSADVTPVILTRNEAVNIGRTLSQLAWANEVLVIDSLSTDDTVSIAKSFPNVRVVERPFDNLAAQWNFALAQARTSWALALDADYFVSDAFVLELRALEPAPDITHYSAAFVYAIHGRPLRASLYPARPVLLRRDRASFWMDGHTHRITIDGRDGMLRERIIHDDRKPFSRFVERQRIYMRDEAAKIRRGAHLNMAGRIRKLRIVAPFAVVIHSLFVKGLILDGIPGLIYTWERFVAEVILSIALVYPDPERSEGEGSSVTPR
jgi:glycosyltransferase involved in cell wall biosynthesis